MQTERKFYPLTHAQKRIWYVEKMNPGTNEPNISFLVRYKEEINFELLSDAINDVLRRNDGLRLHMIETERDDMIEARQYVSEYREYTLDFFDFSGEDAESRLSVWVDEKSKKLFNILDNDLYYMAMIRFNDKECGYYILTHHLISDGWTLNLLLNEIDEIYHDLVNGKPIDHTPYPSYVEYISNEAEYLKSLRCAEHKRFWHELMRPVPEEINLSFRKTKTKSVKAVGKLFAFSSELREKMHRFRKENHSSLFKLVLSALSIHISRITSLTDFAIGTVNHNRATSRHKAMTGMFVSTFPIRFTLDEKMNFQSFVQNVGTTVNNIIKNYQQYPFDILANDLRRETGKDASHLLNVNLVGHPNVTEQDIKLKYIFPGDESTPLTIHMNVSGKDAVGELELLFIYQVELFTEEDVAGIFHSLQNILDEYLDDPDRLILAHVFEHRERSLYEDIQPADVREYYPLSSAQKRLVVLDQKEDPGRALHVHGVVSIHGALDLEKLGRAVDLLVDRHEVLRTSLEIVDSEPVQKYLDRIKLKKVFLEAEKGEIPSIINDFIKSFDLTRTPLFRVALIKVSPQQNFFVFDAHQIICDEVSVDILMNELWRIYRGEELPPARLTSKDYAVWQNQLRNSYELKKQERIWLDMFTDDVPLMNLQTDFPRASSRSFSGAKSAFTLNNGITSQLRKTAKDQGSSIESVLLAAYKILLAKYTSQTDLVVGLPFNGRTTDEMAEMTGMFLNYLPIRSFPEKEKTFRQFLKELEKRLEQTRNNRDFQFDDLVEKIGARREPGRNPLFDVIFEIKEPSRVMQLNGLKIEPFDSDPDFAMFDLSLEIVDHTEELKILIRFRQDLFKQETVERFSRHFRHLLMQICQNPDIQLKDIQLVSQEEREILLHDFNDTAAPYPADKTIHQIIVEGIQQYPHRTAIVYQNRNITYGELESKSKALAHLLRAKGVKLNHIVAILAERCPEVIIAMVAVLRAGGAYVPIDPKYPQERIEYMLEDSGAAVLLTQKHLAGKVAFTGNVLDLMEEGLYEGETKALTNVNTPQDPAYVIYTSGSTGKPKGVLIRHRSVVNFITWHSRQYEITGQSHCAEYASFSFDASISQIYSPLFTGAELHILSDDIRLSPDDLNNYFEMNRIMYVDLPTQMCEQFTEMTDNQSLKYMSTGGEKLKNYKLGHFKLMDEYGPTEYTVVTTNFFIDKLYDKSPIGKPIANTRIYILDEENHLQPIGIPGELCISGVGLAQGYLNRPDLTEEKFVPDPFVEGEKMYRTGDLARWLPDGNIDFIGRIDYQVKIRGFRIEIEEIEQHLSKHEDIKRVVVLDKDDKSGNKYLAAYFESDRDLTDDALIEFLGASLPEYMIPSLFIQVGEMPLNRSGKIDRNVLLNMDIKKGRREEPRNEKEKIILAAWQQVLGFEDIGIHDNFFHLGGHSLKAISLVARLQKNFDVTVNDIFQHQTIAELAENVAMIKDNLFARLENLKETSSGVKPGIEQIIQNDPVARQALEEYAQNNRRYDTISLDVARNYKNILLTGATGFLGIYLLRELLQTKSCHVVLSVRGESDDHAKERLMKRMEYYFGPELSEKYKDRMTVLKSDLSKNLLDLDKNVYSELSNQVDCIINSAANVRHYGVYQEFYDSNVRSVENLIQFAGTGKMKDLHHISTVSVGMGNVGDKDYVLYTEDDLDVGQAFDHVYVKSKLESEERAVDARKMGINASVYRVGNITFDSVLGKFQKNIEENAFFQDVKSYVNLGIVPDGLDEIDLSFVDCLSKAIILLSDRAGLQNETFHLKHSQFVKLSDLLTSDELQLNIQRVTFHELIDFLMEFYDRKGFGSYIENFMLHRGWLDEDFAKLHTECVVISDRTEQILRKIGFEWKTIDVTKMQKMILESIRERIDFLWNAPMLKGLSRDVAEHLAIKATQTFYADETDVLWEGDADRHFYLVVDGNVEVSKKSKAGWSGTLKVLGKGEFLGEESVMEARPSSVTAEAILGDLLVFRFSGDDIRFLIEKSPDFMWRFLKEMTRKVNNLENFIVNIG